MRDFRLRTDLERSVINGFALPLGLVPGESARVVAPTPGYTIDFHAGEDDESDSYTIYAVASHERVAGLVERMFDLLSDEVCGIVEIGSRDAYRTLDVYMAQEPTSHQSFAQGWKQYRDFILEDGSIGCGANCENPFVEVFLDSWKGLWVHVPPLMRDDVDRILAEFDLEQVTETWPELDDDEANEALRLRPVLEMEDEFSPGVEEMLLELRHAWGLELNIDPNRNVDDSGRAVGTTLWHAVIIVQSHTSPAETAYASIWGTAGSLAEIEGMIMEAINGQSDWRFSEMYTIDRVAHDERPDELTDLPPRRTGSEIHLIEFDT